MKQVTRVVEAPEGIGIDMIGVPPGSPIRLDLSVESVVEGVLVTGTAEVRLEGQCARCLEAIADVTEIDLQDLFCHPDKELDDPEASRPHFRALARLRDELSRVPRAGIDLGHLSMGMSVDLEAAIAEGATLVRVGTAIFGERRPRH